VTSSNRMHLVMFDIDGTLTDTMKADEECFVRSFVEVFGFTDIDTDWSHYRHATDSGILHEICVSRMGRPPTGLEVSRFRRRFIELLAAASSRAQFALVAGADRFLSRLARGDTYRVSLATGCWRDSARLKLASVGMCFDDYPAASADDAPDRESILTLSRQRAVERYGGPSACIAYVGDGVWDARACRALSIPFIGIASGNRAARLASEGAVHVFQDFSDDDLLLKSLDELTRMARQACSGEPPHPRPQLMRRGDKK